MIPDPDAEELAFIDDVIAEDDRLRAERQWEAAQCRSADAPVRKNGPDGLVYKEHGNSAPARALTYDAPADDAPAPSVFGDPALDQALSAYTETVGEFVGEYCRQTRDEAQAAVQKQIAGLREELAELRGFANAVRGISAPERWFKLRGNYREGGTYNRLDIVSRDGAWWVAKCDDAGVCPGQDWVRGPVGEPGDKGSRGERGLRGAPGRDAPKFVGWTIDRAAYRAIAKMSDGSEMPPLELRGLFEQFLSELERRGP